VHITALLKYGALFLLLYFYFDLLINS
jgi:hypothetical protein